MRGNFDNSLRIARLILRRERVISTLWIIFLLAFSLSLAPAMNDMFSGDARAALAESLKNPGMVAMMGPVFGADNYTAGAMYAGTMLLWILITVAIMNIFLIVRHTRADEESGRVEVVRSLPTGRLANLNAAMISAVIVNVILGLLMGLGLAATGVEGMSFDGSMLYGATVCAVGLVFAAITAVFCQLASTSRGAMSYSVFTLGVCYMMRAAGDLNAEALSLISTLGLAQRVQVYVGNYWWPVFVLLAEAVALTVAAYALNAIRDMGQGFIPVRPGRKEASMALRSPLGLAFRLLRNTLITWIIVLFVLGASYGSVLNDIEQFVAESPLYQSIIGVNANYSMAEMFTTMVNAMMALFCLIPLFAAALKPRAEEQDGRAEQVLNRAVSRVKYLGGYVFLAFAASVLLQLATATGLYLAAAAVLTQPIALSLLIKANLVYLPALWVMIGVAILLVGLAPRATTAVWGYFGFSFFITFIGRALSLPEWFAALTPYHYIPQLPVDVINWGSLAALTAIAVVLTAAGFMFYRRRDLKV